MKGTAFSPVRHRGRSTKLIHKLPAILLVEHSRAGVVGGYGLRGKTLTAVSNLSVNTHLLAIFIASEELTVGGMKLQGPRPTGTSHS